MKAIVTVLTVVWLVAFAAIVVSVRWPEETEKMVGNSISLEAALQGLLVMTFLIPLVLVTICWLLSDSRRAAKKQLAGLQQTLKKIGFDLEGLERTQAAVASGLENEDAAVIERRLQILEGAVADANGKLVNLQSTPSESDGDFKTRLEAVRVKQAALKDGLAALTNGSQAIKSALEELEEEKNNLESDLSELDEDDLDSDMRELEESVDKAAKRLGNLQGFPARLSELRQKLESTQQVLELLADDDKGVTVVYNELKELGEEIEGSLDEINEEDLESEIGDLESKQEKLAGRVDTVNSLMDRLKSLKGDFPKISPTTSS